MSNLDAGVRSAQTTASDLDLPTSLALDRTSPIGIRTTRGISRVMATVLASPGLLFVLLSGVMASSSADPLTGLDAGSRFVKAYGNATQEVEFGLTPESVDATADGGYVALALTDSPNGYGVN